MAYSKELKNSVIQKMLPPNNQSLKEIQSETGISIDTLKKWQQVARRGGFAAPAGQTSSECWSTKDKFLIVVETAPMNESEISEYCRKKGLYVEQVKAWQDNCLQANGGVAEELSLSQKRERGKDKILKKIQKELQRKESALAEVAALLVLKGKTNAIWKDQVVE